MINLTSQQHALLKRIARHGSSGMSHGGLSLWDLAPLADNGLIELKAAYAFITQKGVAFVHRVAA